MYLFFDTETSGLATDGGQLMQLGAILTDAQFMELATLDTLVQVPAQTQIHPKALAAHGITLERCQAEGRPAAQALAQFAEMAARAQISVAFNNKFDLLIMANMFKQYELLNPLEAMEHRCPMTELTPIIKLPGKFKGTYKWPKLQEAYTFIMGHGFDGAHDALSDVKATIECFKWLERNRRPTQTQVLQDALKLGANAIASL